jgi:hypothetical protein
LQASPAKAELERAARVRRDRIVFIVFVRLYLS